MVKSFCFFLLGFETIEAHQGPPKFKCIICGSKSGSKLENVRKHLATSGHKLRLAQLNELAQNPTYQNLTGMNIKIDDLPVEENLFLNEDILTPILDDISHSIHQDICLSSNDLQEFTNAYENSSSDVESVIDMALEDLFDMISGGIDNDWLPTGPQPGSNQALSPKGGLISDWYPFPNKEVC